MMEAGTGDLSDNHVSCFAFQADTLGRRCYPRYSFAQHLLNVSLKKTPKPTLEAACVGWLAGWLKTRRSKRALVMLAARPATLGHTLMEASHTAVSEKKKKTWRLSEC